VSAAQHILVVDDVELNRELASHILAAHGHSVETAADGAAAVALCLETRFDVIFMDVRMMGMDGLQAARAIRAGGASAATPIFALTAGVRSEQIAACLSAGMDGYVAKPIMEGDLLQAVAVCSGGSAFESEKSWSVKEAVDNISTRFMTRLAEDRRVLAATIGGAQGGEIAELVHRIAGSAGSLGFEEIGARASMLDELLSREAPDFADALRALVRAIDEELHWRAA
jgi:CheY-like chemotaxis protein